MIEAKQRFVPKREVLNRQLEAVRLFRALSSERDPQRPDRQLIIPTDIPQSTLALRERLANGDIEGSSYNIYVSSLRALGPEVYVTKLREQALTKLFGDTGRLISSVEIQELSQDTDHFSERVREMLDLHPRLVYENPAIAEAMFPPDEFPAFLSKIIAREPEYFYKYKIASVIQYFPKEQVRTLLSTAMGYSPVSFITALAQPEVMAQFRNDAGVQEVAMIYAELYLQKAQLDEYSDVTKETVEALVREGFITSEDVGSVAEVLAIVTETQLSKPNYDNDADRASKIRKFSRKLAALWDFVPEEIQQKIILTIQTFPLTPTGVQSLTFVFKDETPAMMLQAKDTLMHAITRDQTTAYKEEEEKLQTAEPEVKTKILAGRNSSERLNFHSFSEDIAYAITHDLLTKEELRQLAEIVFSPLAGSAYQQDNAGSAFLPYSLTDSLANKFNFLPVLLPFVAETPQEQQRVITRILKNSDIESTLAAMPFWLSYIPQEQQKEFTRSIILQESNKQFDFVKAYLALPEMQGIFTREDIEAMVEIIASREGVEFNYRLEGLRQFFGKERFIDFLTVVAEKDADSIAHYISYEGKITEYSPKEIEKIVTLAASKPDGVDGLFYGLESWGSYLTIRSRSDFVQEFVAAHGEQHAVAVLRNFADCIPYIPEEKRAVFIRNLLSSAPEEADAFLFGGFSSGITKKVNLQEIAGIVGTDFTREFVYAHINKLGGKARNIVSSLQLYLQYLPEAERIDFTRRAIALHQTRALQVLRDTHTPGFTIEDMVAVMKDDTHYLRFAPKTITDATNALQSADSPASINALVNNLIDIYTSVDTLNNAGMEKHLYAALAANQLHASQEQTLLLLFVTLEILHRTNEANYPLELAEKMTSLENASKVIITQVGSEILGRNPSEEEISNFLSVINSPMPLLIYFAFYRNTNSHKDFFAGMMQSMFSGKEAFATWRKGEATEASFEELESKGKIPTNITFDQYLVWIQEDRVTRDHDVLSATASEVGNTIQQFAKEHASELGLRTISSEEQVHPRLLKKIQEETRVVGHSLAEAYKALALYKKQDQTGSTQVAIRLREDEIHKLQEQRTNLEHDKRILRIIFATPEEIAKGHLVDGKSKGQALFDMLAELQQEAGKQEVALVYQQIAQWLTDFRQQSPEAVDLQVFDTTDLSLTMEIGRKPVGSCQDFIHGAFKKCLTGYTNYHIRPMFLRRADRNSLVARSILRVLDTSDNRLGLHLEHIYQSSASPLIRRVMYEHAMRLAERMNIQVYVSISNALAATGVSVPDGFELVEMPAGFSMRSPWRPRAPFEYVDSAEKLHVVEGTYSLSGRIFMVKRK